MKFVSIILSPIFYIIFGLLLLVFHPIEIIAFNIFGVKIFRKSIILLNRLVFHSLKIIGTNIKVIGRENIPDNEAIVIVSNHQSMWDIPFVIWIFRKYNTRFIAKKELGKNLPTVSYILRKNLSALIDRKNGSQSIKEIIKVSRRTKEDQSALCIFPEGTRSRNGKLRRFKESGLKTIFKVMPEVKVVPFVIDGNYKLHRYGKMFINPFQTITVRVLEPIEIKNDYEEKVKEIESLIKSHLEK